MMKKLARFGSVVLFIIVIQIVLTCSPAASQGMVIDHTCTDLSQIPDYWLDQAKANLHIAYQHTSHGSQLITGMNALENFPSFGSKYAWVDDSGTTPGALNLDDYGIPGTEPDLSQGDYIDGNGVTPWVTATRNLLNNPSNSHINVIMWSWCSINGHNIQRYLDNMEILIAQYSSVNFVFMTGHAEGQGEGGFIHTANQQIRQHCENNNRILFDFADIENYDPDDNYYYDRPMWDDLDYNLGHVNNWGQEWCTSNTGSELEQLTTGNGVAGYGGCNGCAHSDSPQQANLNCVLKGRACWWMMARLAGWDPGGVNPGLQARFTSSRTRGPAPLTVNFTDQSTGSPTDWSWTFGDGGTSFEASPSHAYLNIGTYTVTLEVSNGSGTDSITKTDLVSVGDTKAWPWCLLLGD